MGEAVGERIDVTASVSACWKVEVVVAGTRWRSGSEAESLAPEAWGLGRHRGTFVQTAAHEATFEVGDGERVVLFDSEFVTLECALRGRP